MGANDSIVLAVLAGGEGSRMGMPKAMLRVAGRPILEFLLDRFAWPGPTWLITAPGREAPPGHERFTRELVDPEPGLGPLRGVLTALEAIDDSLLLVTPVDMPGMGPDVLLWAAKELRSRPEACGLMCRRDMGSGDGIEPFPLALRQTARPVVRRRLEEGRRSVRQLGGEPGFVVARAPADWPPTLWLNLNEPGDLAAVEGLGE